MPINTSGLSFSVGHDEYSLSEITAIKVNSEEITIESLMGNATYKKEGNSQEYLDACDIYKFCKRHVNFKIGDKE